MDAYGGTDEESVELRKLLTEVVRFAGPFTTTRNANEL